MAKHSVVSVLDDQLRARWLDEIAELGSIAAAEDAAQAFVLRMGCSLDDARLRVRRAWQMLGIESARHR
jgi:hypothetical protein